MNTLRRSMLAFLIATGAAGSAATFAAAQSTGDAALRARVSDAAGVRVAVRPKSIAAGSPWEFDVLMDTHTKPLNEDLAKSAVLIDDGGRRYAPLSWQGDPPGGHHRKGVLRFPAPVPNPKSFEVQIEGVGGPGKRVFQWKAN